jgi:hypothetical protein
MKLFSWVPVIITLLLLLPGCNATTRKGEESAPIHRLSTYAFSLTVPLSSRITEAPTPVIEHLRKLDDRPDYTSWIPTGKDRQRINRALAELPSGIRHTLSRRAIGIYFVEDFLTYGLTEWVVDEEGNTYVFMVFARRALSGTAGDIITDRENTTFVDDGSGCTLKHVLTPEIDGFYYILLHESVHAFDYVNKITPWVEPALKEPGRDPETNRFTRGIWSKYRTTVKTYAFRKGLRFYGFGKGPFSQYGKAMDIYSGLEDSPFASLYGSVSWAEDLAELETLYHITRRLKRDYVITVSCGENTKSFYPMKNKSARDRFQQMDVFYKR